MRDWRAFVREHVIDNRILTNGAIDELAQHVEETWRAAKSAGRSDAEALAAARARNCSIVRRGSRDR